MHDLARKTSATTAPADHGAEGANTQQLLYCLSCRGHAWPGSVHTPVAQLYAGRHRLTWLSIYLWWLSQQVDALTEDHTCLLLAERLALPA